MRILDKLDRKFGKFAIKHLMMYIVSINLAVYLLMYFIDTEGNLFFKFLLHPELVRQGEYWRLLTFIFIPPLTSPMWVLFSLYFYYMIGESLEREWGSFKFNLFYLVGVLGTILAAFISGNFVIAEYLNLSLFIAFACIFPNYEIMLFFVLPVPVKYLAIIDGFYLGHAFFTGGVSTKLMITVAFLNLILFFGKEAVMRIKGEAYAYNNRRSFQKKLGKKNFMHKCTICGITEIDNPHMEFRYCSRCEGDYEYCMVHLAEHEHVKK